MPTQYVGTYFFNKIVGLVSLPAAVACCDGSSPSDYSPESSAFWL